MRNLANQSIRTATTVGVAVATERIFLPIVFAFVFCLFFNSPISAESPHATEDASGAGKHLQESEPEEVGMSSNVLAKVKPAIQKLVDDHRIPGAIVIASRQGKIVLFESVGWRDIENQTAMKRDSVLRFYSMTKPITSTAIMMLVEQGKIALDDPASKYIPQFANLKVFASKDGADEFQAVDREMTIRDLLRHTSGLTYGFFGSTPVDRKYQFARVLNPTDTLLDTVEKLGKLPLVYQPGTRFNYSVSTDVLGHVVEVVSKQRLDTFFEQHIFEPLGMNDTAFHVAAENVSRFSSNYGPKLGGSGLRVIDASDSSRYLKVPSLYSGGGGLVSTAGDYIRFCQMLLNKGEYQAKRLLESATVEQMTRNQLPDSAYPIGVNDRRDGVGFGLGFSVVVEKSEYTKLSPIGEFGWGGAASTHFWISPKDELAVVALMQHMPFSFLLENAVKPLIYDAIKE